MGGCWCAPTALFIISWLNCVPHASISVITCATPGVGCGVADCSRAVVRAAARRPARPPACGELRRRRGWRRRRPQQKWQHGWRAAGARGLTT